MDISSSEINVFLAIAQHGSVTSAANTLGITQPTATRALQKLERELNAQLFIRSKKGVTLTRSGKHLRASSKKLITSFIEIKEILKAEKETLQGTYSIGVHADLAGHTLPKFVSKLLHGNSKLELQFSHNLSRIITKKVANLELDFGIVVNPFRYPDLTITKLYSDEVGFWMAKNSSWSRNLKAENVPIICNPSLLQTSKLIKKINKKGYFPNARMIHTSNLELISDLVKSDAGIGIIPKTISELHHKPHVRCIATLPILKDIICLVYRNDMLRGTSGHKIKSEIIGCF